MIQTLMGWLDGKKTYLACIGWMIYKIGVTSTWWPENNNVEALLLGSGALALREGIKKSGPK